MAESIHLVKVPLRAHKLVAFARSRALPVREFDDGYVAHAVMRELWQERAPAPFALRGQGGLLEAWGYAPVDAGTLAEGVHASQDAAIVGTLGRIDDMQSRTVPRIGQGRRVGFVVRACPVVRLAKARNGHRAGAEVDAFLARCFAVEKGVPLSREGVYREWLERALSRPGTGVVPRRVGVAAMSRTRLLRRTHGTSRASRQVERPDVTFEGEVVVEDGDLLLRYLAHGVGRHRAFGFGALMLTPAGTAADLAAQKC
jgi:CRISPR system Cascade subunit CasE